MGRGILALNPINAIFFASSLTSSLKLRGARRLRPTSGGVIEVGRGTCQVGENGGVVGLVFGWCSGIFLIVKKVV